MGDEGNITLTVVAADDEDDRGPKLDQARDDSRQKSHEYDVYWVFALHLCWTAHNPAFPVVVGCSWEAIIPKSPNTLHV